MITRNRRRLAEQEAASAASTPSAITTALAKIERAHGAGTVIRLGDRPREAVSVIPTGSISLDIALGVWGAPRGRIIEIYGPESSGKTTLAAHIVANAQRAGGTAAYVDAEHAVDTDYFHKLGVDVDELLFSQPDNGEQALSVVEDLTESREVAVIVVDSVANLVPKAEIDGEMGDSAVGLQARMMSQAMRKLTGIASRTNTLLIFINQIREKIGVVFGSPEIQPGGRALKFYSSVRIDIRRIGAIKEGTINVGNRVRAKIVKNKLAPPFREAEFDIRFGTGIDRISDLLDTAKAEKVIELAGSHFHFGGERLGNGRDAARATLAENAQLARQVEEAIRRAVTDRLSHR